MYVLSREGEYYFIEYSSCRFRTTRAFPGRTGGVSLEESEEEEGGEGLKGTSPAKMLLGRCLTPLWKDGCPAATTEGPEARGLFGDTERGHLQEPGWGRPSLKGHPWLPPPLPRQLIQGGRRWDTPRGGHKDIATPGCRATTTWHWLTVTAGWGFLLSSLPGGGKDHLQISRSPNPAHPISRERVEGGRRQDQQEECRSCH